MNDSLRRPRVTALWAIAIIISASSLVSFAESYRGLFDFSHEHGLSGLWSAVWPLQIDVFIAVGELALFIGLVERWENRSRYAAWAVTFLGLAVSVAGNVAHVTSPFVTDRLTAAVPPLAAAASLSVGLGVLKRIRASTDNGWPTADDLVQLAREAFSAERYGQAAALIDAAERRSPGHPAIPKARAAVAAADRYEAIEEEHVSTSKASSRHVGV